MDCVLLRFDAPMMSFGGVLVDQHNRTDRFPGRAMLTGLVANALGWKHGDFGALNALQERVSFAARWDVPPQSLRDYHTVDLGQPHLREAGWTTRGAPEHREGGIARHGTHQRYRHYWVDGVLTLALTVEPGEPSLQVIAEALARPARPLFLGRKNCLPAARILLGMRNSPSLLEALCSEPAHSRADGGSHDFEACWPQGLAEPDSEARQRVQRTDDRDWANQVHVGTRTVVEGRLRGEPPCT